jgi:hypothetical protein
MTRKWTFPKQIAAVTAVFLVAGMYPLSVFAESHVVAGAAIGLALSLLHVSMGYAAFEYSMKKPYGTFVQIVLGGIVIRLFVMVAVLAVLIVGFHIHVIALVSSLFITYVVFLVMEIMHIQERAKKESQESKAQ